jgi:hypothetical protein
MDHLFSTALTFRNMLVSGIDKMDDELLDLTPEGYNNNIRWNLAHLVVTPGLLTYRLVGKDIPLLSVEFIDSCKKGSQPDDFSLNEDYSKKHLCELLIETVKQSQRDFEELFKETFKPYETSTGFVIQDLPSALSFSNIHDGMHIGSIRMLKKIIETGF